MVSLGLHIALTTAGIAGATSGLMFVSQHLNSAVAAALVTCGFVSQTCPDTCGMILGKSGEICLGWADAH
jgi:hypothetical protein